MVSIPYSLRQLQRRLRSLIGRPLIIRQDRIVPLTESDVCDDPIFVLGVKRSGTSLIRRVLNSHTAIACPPETYFLEHFVRLHDDPQTPPGLEGFGIDPAGNSAAVRRWAALYHDAFRRAQGKRRWADKTPEYVRIAAGIDRLFDRRAQYVLVIRHPIAIAQSIAYRGLNAPASGDQPLLAAARDVATELSRLIDFGTTHPERCYWLYYEDLMRAPEATLQPLFDFLHEPWEPAVLDFNRHEHGHGSEDPIVRGTPNFAPHYFDPASLPARPFETVLAVLRPSMERLGYAAGDAFPVGAVGERPGCVRYCT